MFFGILFVCSILNIFLTFSKMNNKLLLIDDDEIASFLVGKLVKKNPVIDEFVVQENGLDAMNYLHSLDDNDLFPSVILVDLDMPVMDGYEFLHLYQKTFWKKHPKTKVVMVTSSRRKVDWEKALEYKCVEDCLYKPINQNFLTDIFEKTAVA